MSSVSDQTKKWMSAFGREYTKRNTFSTAQLDALWKERYGISRSALNHAFLSGIDPSIRILEVGSNVGQQLLVLREMGFEKLYGVELQLHAARLAKTRTKNIEVVQGTVFRIPYADQSFDLVFTSGLLIHINPSEIVAALREIYRCSLHYIWGFEYFAERYTDVNYRGYTNLLWKTNFASLYLSLFKDLELVKETRLTNLGNPQNLDSMFMLKKSEEER